MFFTKVGNDFIKLGRRGHETAEPIEMHFFTEGSCICTNYSSET
jgi:hypothetical protein